MQFRDISFIVYDPENEEAHQQAERNAVEAASSADHPNIGDMDAFIYDIGGAYWTKFHLNGGDWSRVCPIQEALISCWQYGLPTFLVTMTATTGMSYHDGLRLWSEYGRRDIDDAPYLKTIVDC